MINPNSDESMEARIIALAHCDSILESSRGNREREVYILSYIVCLYIIKRVREQERLSFLEDLQGLVEILLAEG